MTGFNLGRRTMLMAAAASLSLGTAGFAGGHEVTSTSAGKGSTFSLYTTRLTTLSEVPHSTRWRASG